MLNKRTKKKIIGKTNFEILFQFIDSVGIDVKFGLIFELVHLTPNKILVIYELAQNIIWKARDL